MKLFVKCTVTLSEDTFRDLKWNMSYLTLTKENVFSFNG